MVANAFHPEVLPRRGRAYDRGGGLSAVDVYRLKHQHPLNRLTHFIGMPTIVVSIAFPVFAWFAWGVLAWKEWMILSAVGWGLQFLGHAIEGNQPPFFEIPVT
ncbi:MAG TPA: Mpo1-like protein [Methylocella sp.]|nr:Mpo1-like protein [Methylocella sp.]